MELPACQNRLIDEIAKVQPHVVVVLHNGSAVELPWADRVSAILELYLGGEGVGEAADQLLYGEANPSGHLAETFPLRLQDNPSYLHFPGNDERVAYGEDVFVGYRYYDTKQVPVRFAFGHGLSYTEFAYSNLQLSGARIAGWPDCHRQCGCDQHRQGGRARGRPAFTSATKTAHRSVPAKSCAALPRYCWNRASARR